MTEPVVSETISWVSEANVHDGKGGYVPVHVGDKVELNDPNDFMKRWLGPGPYTIKHIGQWRCGRKSLYLKTNQRENDEPGAHASDFKIAS